MARAHERCEFAEGMPKCDVDTVGSLETEFLLQHAQHHDASGHDSGLGMLGSSEGRVWAVGDDGGERHREDIVEFFEEGFTGSREGLKPGRSHADSLNALT